VSEETARQIAVSVWLVMAALRSRCGRYIFVLFLSFFFFLFSSPNLSDGRLDVILNAGLKM